MKTTTLLALTAVLCLPAFSQKRTVSVEEFQYSAVMTEVQAIFGTQVNLGRGIQALMAKRIQQGGQFAVVERANLKVLTGEQDLGASGRIKRGSQARIGELLGAQFKLFGDIVSFGRDDKRKAGGAIAIVPGAGGAAGGYKNTNKAVVTIVFRLVNAETGESVASGEARGESKRESKGGFAALVVPGFGAGGGFENNSTNFAETIIGEAVIDACDQLAKQLEAQANQVRGTINADIEGRVAVVNGGTVYLNVGSDAGVQAGDSFLVSHIVSEVRDPVTKEVLDMQTSPVGTLTIQTVRAKVSIGTLSGGAAQVGDRAEKKK
jgi:curli biogenesis system outer membrane secretion channel CsgG